jgi:hypothetical protein
MTAPAPEIPGLRCGFDRVRLMATLRPLDQPSVMLRYLSRAPVRLKDFPGFARAWTQRGRAAAHPLAAQPHRPLTCRPGRSQRKELLARELARRDGRTPGLIGIGSGLASCLTYCLPRDRAQKKLGLRLAPGNGRHYYFYFRHEQLGPLHLRLQTWCPLALPLGRNGRHWLARQMDQAGRGDVQRENCFTWLADAARAQGLARAQLQSHGPVLLDPRVQPCPPPAAELGRPLGRSSYGSGSASEYATAGMFKRPAALARSTTIKFPCQRQL